MKGQVLVEPGMIPQNAHAGFTLANPLEAMTERGTDVNRHQDEAYQKEDQNEVIVRERVL
jgi:hypothetical protein